MVNVWVQHSTAAAAAMALDASAAAGGAAVVIVENASAPRGSPGDVAAWEDAVGQVEL